MSKIDYSNWSSSNYKKNRDRERKERAKSKKRRQQDFIDNWSKVEEDQWQEESLQKT